MPRKERSLQLLLKGVLLKQIQKKSMANPKLEFTIDSSKDYCIISLINTRVQCY